MSKRYDNYLNEHINNVKKGFDWLKENCMDIFPDQDWYMANLENNILNHDKSKYSMEEYDDYDRYFYGLSSTGRSYEAVTNFKHAWLHHIHNNPHHWQYWILVNDDESTEILDMPFIYIIEMICDWWSFGWAKNDLYELFSWYENKKRKGTIQMSDYTRGQVEFILSRIKEVLDNKKNERE